MSKEFWVEILAVGEWVDASGTRVNLRTEDLHQIRATHEEIYPDVEPALRLGDHPGLEPGVKPAVGWVPKLKVEGEKLLGLFTDIPEILMRAFDKKLYKNVSAGLWKNWRFKGKTYPYVLNHVAVLGAEVPAVSGLADLQAYLSAGTNSQVPEGVVSFTRGCENQESEPMPKTELEIRLEADLQTMKETNVALTAERDALKGEKEKLAAANKGLEESNIALKAEVADFDQKTAMAEVSSVVDEAIKEERLLPKDKDRVVAEGLALRTASVNLKSEDINPFDSWKDRLANGGKAIDLSNKSKADEEEETGFDADMKMGADAAREATGQKVDDS